MLVMFWETEDGIWITDQGGLPINQEEAAELQRLLADYIETRTAADILARKKAVVRKNFPGMYSQMFDEE